MDFRQNGEGTQRRGQNGGGEQERQAVDLETVKISWSLLKIVGGVVSGAAAIIYITIKINTFWYQAEIFRTEVTTQIALLNDSVKTLVIELGNLAKSPDIIRPRDLSEFCVGLEQENNGIGFHCPPAYQYSVRRNQQAQGWKAQ